MQRNEATRACPLSRVDQKGLVYDQNDENDPTETCAPQDCCDADKKRLRRQDRPQRQHPVPNRMTKARAVPMPSNSVLAPLYAGADLLDAFAIQLPARASDDLELLARAALERQAWWIRALTRVRDVVMATVAVKSSRAVGLAAAARGPVIGFFPVLSKSATELVVGADDWHLDFRVTIQLRADAANGRELARVPWCIAITDWGVSILRR
jgi:hypothetical protein